MILRKSLSYLIISVIAKGFAFGIVLFMPKFLSAEQFGNAAIYITSISFISIFLSFGTQSVVPKYYHQENIESFRQSLGAIFSIIFLVYFFGVVLVLLVLTFWLEELINPLLVLTSSFCLALINVCLSYYRTVENIRKYAIIELSLSSFLFFVPLILMLNFEGRVEYWLFSSYLSYVVVAVFSLVLIFNEVRPAFTIKRTTYQRIFKLCAPLIPHSLSLVIISSSDRFVVKGTLGAEVLAYYIIANNFAMITKIVSDAFMKAWSPFYFKNKMDNNAIAKAKSQFFLTLLFFVFFYNVIVWFSFDFIFSEEYAQAKNLIFPLSLAYFIASHYQVLVPVLIDRSLTNVLSKITPLCALTNLIINLLLLKEFGIWVAIISTFISYIMLSTLVSLKVKHEKCNS